MEPLEAARVRVELSGMAGCLGYGLYGYVLALDDTLLQQGLHLQLVSLRNIYQDV